MQEQSQQTPPKTLKVNNEHESSDGLTCPQPYLGKIQEAPHFVRDNKHIHGGYRLNYESPKKIAKTLFMLHNQTGNIWTHLIGFIIVFFLIFQCIAYNMESTHVLASTMLNDVIPHEPTSAKLISMCQLINKGKNKTLSLSECKKMIKQRQKKQSKESDLETWPIMAMLAGGAICLACSTTFHLLFSANQKIYVFSRSLDYAGIGINMAFSPIPACYYGFFCDKTVAMTYITLITISGVLSFSVSLIDWFQKQEHFKFKAVIFVLSSIVSIVGLVHFIVREMIYHNHGDGFSIVPALYFFLPALGSYAIGFYTYVRQYLSFYFRCPERYNPGKFDICGHSHQIWHIFVFLGIMFTYLGSLLCYELRNRYETCPNTLSHNF